MFVNGASILTNGRLGVVLTNPSESAKRYNAALAYDTAEKLCTALPGASPQFSVNGLRVVNGRLVTVTSEVALVDARYSSGLAFAPAGGLYVNQTLPVVYHRGGWPVASNGSVCIDSGVVNLNAFSNGFDTGYD